MFCARLFICASWSPAGKGLTSWLSFVVSSVSLSLSHWYPGSGVVLDCIDSWSLQPYLLYFQKLVFKTNYGLMQVKSIAEHSAILSNFIKLWFVIKIFVLSIFEWPFYCIEYWPFYWERVELILFSPLLRSIVFPLLDNKLTLCILGNFSLCFVVYWIFSKLTFSSINVVHGYQSSR